MRILSIVLGTVTILAAAGACSGGGSSAGDIEGGANSGSSTGGGAGSASSSGASGASSSGGTTSSGGSSGGSGASSGGGALVTYGQPFTGGQYNLGPVDYAETQFHNACGPTGTTYDPRVQSAEGTLLAGLWIQVNGGHPEDYCDACIWVVTGKGKSAMLRVVTNGDTTTNSIDVSQNAYQILDTGEYPRAMTWQLVKCPDTGPMLYEFKSASSEYWTSLWVRNARVPLSMVEVKSASNPSYVALARESDGSLTNASGFGNGSFSIRSTGIDGQVVVDTFAWPASGIASAFLTGQGNFQ